MQPCRAILVLTFGFLVGCGTIVPLKTETQISTTPVAAPALDPSVALIEPLAPADVWAVLREGFALEHAPQQPSVARAVAAYRASTSMTPAMEVRARRYFAFVVDEVRQRKLPTELALLPIVESTLNPYAFSRSGAAGLWQLIPATAKQQGVTINWWYDGRRDLIDSTTAALDYLTYLHDEFGDWLLAMAAYNGGEGRLRRALKKSPGSGFFELKLPRETQRYIPQVLALAHLIAQDNNLVLPRITAESPFFTAMIDNQIDLDTLTAGSSLPLDEVFTFNPGLNRRATPPGRPYRLVIPASYRAAFENAIDRYPTHQTPWQRHHVQHGENLSSIAKRFHTTSEAIRAANGLSSNLIHPNQSLLIPVAAINASTLAANPMVNAGRQWHEYKAKSGDSLWSISRRFDTSITTLLRVNQLDRARALKVGQMLVVPGRASGTRSMTYTVKAGDSLARIASSHRVSIAEIVAWNDVDPTAVLKPGRRLVLHIRAVRDWS
jgi:membrane-bound lytic murein transglycosylase D